MTKRLLSTIALWGTVVVVLWLFRTTGAVLLLGLISALAVGEFYLLLRAAGQPTFMWLGMTFGALITMSPWPGIWLHSPLLADPAVMLALAAVAFSIRILGERTPETRVEALGSTLFGLFYISFLLHFLVRIITPTPNDIDVTPDTRLLLGVWFVAVVKFCDVGALLTGMAFGKHKMSPHISPKKTWEGAVGGVLVSMALGALGAWLLRDRVPPHLTPLYAALIAAPIAIVGIISDLIESVIKRRANRKDSGTGIPGIGGVFDMADSLLLTAPVAYLLLRL